MLRGSPVGVERPWWTAVSDPSYQSLFLASFLSLFLLSFTFVFLLPGTVLHSKDMALDRIEEVLALMEIHLRSFQTVKVLMKIRYGSRL